MRWDLRFTSIGEASRSDDTRTSALRFESRHPLSPLRSGSGYWRYVPGEAGARFVTGFDYEPGWGLLGRAVDPWALRPLTGWLTALSFDTLRFWLEDGVSPEQLRRRGAADLAARALLVGSFAAGVRRLGRGGKVAVSAAAVMGAFVVETVHARRRCRTVGVVTAVFQVSLGADFVRLHPMLWTVSFLRLGAWRNILFPENATDVPFTIENYSYVDSFGRETLTFVRTFELSRTLRRRFDATMVTHPETGRVVDYLGTHPHLAVDPDVRVDDHGSLYISSDEQRFREGLLSFRFPQALTGHAALVESYDDATGCFTIDVAVTNARFGRLFGYRGTFTCDWPVVADVPSAVKPVREERRP